MMSNMTVKLGTVGVSKIGSWFDMRVMSVHGSALLKAEFKIDAEDENDVLLENVKDNGIVTLNRPKALNTLLPKMLRKIHQALKEWEGSKKLVIIKGTGQRAFCAGGDIVVGTSNLCVPGGIEMLRAYWREQYTLNYLIRTYKTPYIAIMNGVTMGGGAGLSVHGRYRIATENTIFSMPEVAIGLFPDVGASFFLPRLEGKLGNYLALTADRLKGTDVLKAGIATHYVSSERLADLTNDLLDSNSKDIDGTIKKYQPDNFNPEFSLNPYLKQIDDCFSAPTMEEVIHRLESDGSDWAVKSLKLLEKMSPTSLSVTHQALQKGSQQSLAECLKMELRLIYRALTKDDDFSEGVRALLVDKDKKPLWKPKNLSEISQEDIEARFAKLPDDEELKLR